MATVTALHANYIVDYRLSHELVPMQHRRLADKVLIVFHHACDAMDLEVAEHLFSVLELMAMSNPHPGAANRRLNLESLVSAHERLFEVRAHTA